jgi:hypothetical protein
MNCCCIKLHINFLPGSVTDLKKEWSRFTWTLTVVLHVLLPVRALALILNFQTLREWPKVIHICIREFWDLLYFTSVTQYRDSKSHVLLTVVCDLALAGGNLHIISCEWNTLLCTHGESVQHMKYTDRNVHKIWKGQFLSKIICIPCYVVSLFFMQVAGNLIDCF